MKKPWNGVAAVAAMLALSLAAPAAAAQAGAVRPAVPLTSTTYAETTGSVANTWTNYTDAGGTEGQPVPAFDTVQIACRLTGFEVADGNTWWYQIASSPWNDSFYVSADAFYNNGNTSGSLKGTPFYDPNVPICSPATSYSETTGSTANTWTDYTDAGGNEGPMIGSFATVQVTCALTGFKVADGNTWWYLVASSPWNNDYYASADAFYNNGATSGSLSGTPFVDPNVPICPSGEGTNETTGSATNTWTDYKTASGTQGPTIAAFTTLQVTCKLIGFKVADGNTWWYQIASSPWNDLYYASADAFYNNGQTSGSLVGTPFVDPNVPNCDAGLTVGTLTVSEGAAATNGSCTAADCHYIVLTMTGWKAKTAYTVWFDTDCDHNEPACGAKNHYASMSVTTDQSGDWSGNTRLFGFAKAHVWVAVQGHLSEKVQWQ